MKEEKQKRRNTNKGITLIALVITIIVLLILAGVSIAMLTGENGVLTKATESKEQTEIAQEKEEIQMAYAAAKANKVEDVADQVTADELNTELDKINSKGEASGSGTLTVTFSDSQRKYTINQSTGAISAPITDDTEEDEEKKAIKMIVNSGEDGVVVLPISEEAEIDWGDGNIETANKEKSIQEIASINEGIEVAAMAREGHSHEYAEKNKEYEVTIKGDISTIMSNSAYMKVDNEYIYYLEKIIEITQWGETGLESIYLDNCTKLRRIASPSENSFIKITEFRDTFSGCASLTSIPEDLFSNCPNVDSFQSTFENCIGLTSIPQNLFSNCQNVTDFDGTFSGCTNLTGEAIPLWERVDGWENLDFENTSEWFTTIPNGHSCYRGCEKLSNYSSIPEYWKMLPR